MAQASGVKAPPIDSTVVVIVTCMIILSIAFEKGRDYLERSTRDNLKPILNSLFGELTLLGFIGLMLFVVSKLEYVQVLSRRLFGEGIEITELAEQVHMALFLIMLIFLATVLLLVGAGKAIIERWHEWERTILSEEGVRARYHASVHGDERSNSFYARALRLDEAVMGLEPESYQEATFACLRKDFVNGPPALDPHFDFAQYLEPRLGKTLSEFVEIPVSTWILLEVFVLAAYTCVTHLVAFQNTLALIYLCVGYSLPITMRALHGKVLHVKADACLLGGHLEDFIDTHNNEIERQASKAIFAGKTFDEVAGAGDHRGGSLGSTWSSTSRRSGSSEKRVDGANDLFVSAAEQTGGAVRNPPPGVGLLRMEVSKEVGYNEEGYMVIPVLDLDEDLDEASDGSEVDDLKSPTGKPVSYGSTEAYSPFFPDTDETASPHSSSSRSSSSPPAFVPGGGPDKDKGGGGGGGGGGENPKVVPRSRSAGSFYNLIQQPKGFDPQSLEEHYGFSGYSKSNHHKRFWFGDTHKSHFMLGVLRCTLLVNAVYLALFVLRFLPVAARRTKAWGDSEDWQSKVADGGGGWPDGGGWPALGVIVVFTLLPSAALVNMTTQTIQDFTLVTSIFSMKNNRLIEQSLRRMKTRLGFLTLKVVYMLLQGTSTDRLRVAAGKRSGFQLWRRHCEDTRDRFKGAVNKLIGIKRLVMKIDKMDPSSAAGLASSLARAAEEAEAAADASLADGDDGQPPNFQGLFLRSPKTRKKDEDDLTTEVRLAMECEAKESKRESQERQQRLWKDIFAIFDTDGGGTISNEELGTELFKLAPEGSITDEDVKFLISELDIDGDGEINFDEFQIYTRYIAATVLRDQDKEEISKGMFDLVIGAMDKASMSVGCYDDMRRRDSDGNDPSFDSGLGKASSWNTPRGTHSALGSIRIIQIGTDTVEDGAKETVITIPGLQLVLKNCGQELSADDVFNAIKDIDENGDGLLDEGEFYALLLKLGIL